MASSMLMSVTGCFSRPSGGVPLVQKYREASERNSASRAPETMSGSARMAGDGWPVSLRNCAYSALVTGKVPMKNSSRYALWAGRSSSSPSSAPMANSPAGIRATWSIDSSAISRAAQYIAATHRRMVPDSYGSSTPLDWKSPRCASGCGPPSNRAGAPPRAPAHGGGRGRRGVRHVPGAHGGAAGADAGKRLARRRLSVHGVHAARRAAPGVRPLGRGLHRVRAGYHGAPSRRRCCA